VITGAKLFGKLATRGCALIAVAAVAATAPWPPPLRAQQPSAAQGLSAQRSSPLIRWGKWAAAAAAVGFTTLGIRQHNAGDAAFSDLVHYCRANLCTLTPAGRYADPQAEARYQRVVRDEFGERAVEDIKAMLGVRLERSAEEARG